MISRLRRQSATKNRFAKSSFTTGSCAHLSRFWGNLRNSEIPEYWILPLKRGQKTVRHSEISNYRKNALRKILSNAAPVAIIRHIKSLCKDIPRHRLYLYYTMAAQKMQASCENQRVGPETPLHFFAEHGIIGI
jgi:hypothetical protein